MWSSGSATDSTSLPLPFSLFFGNEGVGEFHRNQAPECFGFTLRGGVEGGSGLLGSASLMTEGVDVETVQEGTWRVSELSRGRDGPPC